MSYQSLLFDVAGADDQLLKRSTLADRIRFTAIGALILLTSASTWGVLSYALIYIFLPKEELTWVDWGIGYPVAIIIGGCGSLMILNFMRFIVSSFGYGDGTSNIRWSEIKNSGFVLLMPILIAGCLTAPVAVLLLHDQIVSHLSSNQRNEIAEATRRVEDQHRAELDQVYFAQAEIKSKTDALQSKIQSLGKPVVQSPAPSAIQSPINAGRQPIFLNSQDVERSNLESKMRVLQSELNRQRNEVLELRAKIKQESLKYEEEIKKDDSLVNETLNAFEIYKPLVFLIGLFMLLIHTAPILMKLLWAKGPYEFLFEFQEIITVTKYGIQPKAQEFTNAGTIYSVDRYTIAEKILKHEKSKHDQIRKQIQEKWKSCTQT
jgi:hypothetical protein